jgi:hypothetical protein
MTESWIREAEPPYNTYFVHNRFLREQNGSNMATGRKENVEVTLQVFLDVVHDTIFLFTPQSKDSSQMSFLFVISEVNSELERARTTAS